MTLGAWDVALIVGVSIQGTILAYLPHPKLKAFVLSLPVPSTLAILALARPVDSTNVVGLLMLFLYVQAIRLLYVRAHVPIVPAIVLPTLAYALLATLLARVLPVTDGAFWLCALGALVLGIVLYRVMPRYNEPSYRTTLPVWIKWPIILTIVICLVVVKNSLLGFMAAFPMVTIVAAYEARHSLGTIGRQVPVVMMTIVPMLMVLRLTQTRLGLAPALFLGWIVLLCLLLPLSRSEWSKRSPIAASAAQAPVPGDLAAAEPHTLEG